MNCEFSPRFKSAAAALRFFFRVSALLYGNIRNPRAASGRMMDLARQPGALGDFLRIGSCVRDMSDVQFFLLGEFYGPTCFAPRPPPGACGASRRVCGLAGGPAGIVRRATLPALRARLRRRRLVISAPAERCGHFARAPGAWHGPDHEKP